MAFTSGWLCHHELRNPRATRPCPPPWSKILVTPLSVFVCVFCLFVNMITSEQVNIRWRNLGVSVLYKNRGRVRIWGHNPLLGAHPRNVAFGYDVGKISANCLVYFCVLLCSSVNLGAAHLTGRNENLSHVRKWAVFENACPKFV